jgi:hypothetical protein
MCGTIPPLPQYVFMAWCLFKHRGNFTFTFTFTSIFNKCVNRDFVVFWVVAPWNVVIGYQRFGAPYFEVVGTSP